MSAPAYLPTAAQVAALGLDPGSLPGEFDCRSPLTPPGIVYCLLGGTGMTGRLFARQHIAYDDRGGEFVFRQPRDEAELRGLGRAHRIEEQGCYRFDGLAHWTLASAWAWWQRVDLVAACLQALAGAGSHREVRRGAQAYLDYLSSGELADYMDGLLQHLARPA